MQDGTRDGRRNETKRIVPDSALLSESRAHILLGLGSVRLYCRMGTQLYYVPRKCRLHRYMSIYTLCMSWVCLPLSQDGNAIEVCKQ
jgi:hypothetical protein